VPHPDRVTNKSFWYQEETAIKKAMALAGGYKNKAAELLGLSLRSIRYRLSKQEEGE